jgi:hypothetical protein
MSGGIKCSGQLRPDTATSHDDYMHGRTVHAQRWEISHQGCRVPFVQTTSYS